MAQVLEDTGNYKILRRLMPCSFLQPDDGTPTLIGIFFDAETTGLSLTQDDVIELAMLKFNFTRDGRIFEFGSKFHAFNQPRKPIPAEVRAITAITDEMVQGYKVDIDALETFIEDASLIVAHNAGFDRPFAERISGAFARKAWACSMLDINWNAEGFAGRRLADLLGAYGLFFDGHRATGDCEAGLALLGQELPEAGGFALGQLLGNARKTTFRVSAVGAPYDCRELLKSWGYKWNGGGAPNERFWYKDVAEEQLDGELKRLSSAIDDRNFAPNVNARTAFDRYSDR